MPSERLHQLLNCHRHCCCCLCCCFCSSIGSSSLSCCHCSFPHAFLLPQTHQPRSSLLAPRFTRFVTHHLVSHDLSHTTSFHAICHTPPRFTRFVSRRFTAGPFCWSLHPNDCHHSGLQLWGGPSHRRCCLHDPPPPLGPSAFDNSTLSCVSSSDGDGACTSAACRSVEATAAAAAAAA